MVSSLLWRGRNSQGIKTKGPTEADDARNTGSY
jgi:hypothetical protein